MTNNILSKDNCIFYGLPGMVILIISTLATVNISSHFNGSTLVTTVAFIGCNGSGLLAYLLLQYFLRDMLQISDIVRGKNNTQLQIVAQSPDGTQTIITDMDEVSLASANESQDDVAKCDTIPSAASTESDEVISNDLIPDAGAQPKEIISNDHLTAPTALTLTQKQYDKAQMAFDNEIAARKAVHERVIMEYVNRIMAPFVEQENLVKLCAEIHEWCEDSHYNPEAIPLKYISDHSSRLKTIDFKHFVWNIGERMYNRTAYNGECRAMFVKSLFPNALSDNTIESMKNLTYQSDKGIIKLDKPKPDSIAFNPNL